MNKQNEYEELYNRYKNITQEELEKIANSGDEYRDIAKQVASDILKSDRTEYYSKINQQKIIEEERSNKIKTTENHPLYPLINQIANDVRFFKTLTIILLIVSIIIGCVAVYQYNQFMDVLGSVGGRGY